MIALPFTDDNLSGSRKGLIVCLLAACLINQIYGPVILKFADAKITAPLQSVKLLISIASIYLFIRLFALIPKEKFDISNRHHREVAEAEQKDEKLKEEISLAIQQVKTDIEAQISAYNKVIEFGDDVERVTEKSTFGSLINEVKLRHQKIKDDFDHQITSGEYIIKSISSHVEKAVKNFEFLNSAVENHKNDLTIEANRSVLISQITEYHSDLLKISQLLGEHRQSYGERLFSAASSADHAKSIIDAYRESLVIEVESLLTHKFSLDKYNEQVVNTAKERARSSSFWEKWDVQIFSTFMPSLILPITNLILWYGIPVTKDNIVPITFMQFVFALTCSVPLSGILSRSIIVQELHRRIKSAG